MRFAPPCPHSSHPECRSGVDGALTYQKQVCLQRAQKYPPPEPLAGAVRGADFGVAAHLGAPLPAGQGGGAAGLPHIDPIPGSGPVGFVVF